MWTIAVIVVGTLALPILLLLGLRWYVAPAEYHGVSFQELQRYFASWVTHVGERRDILVGTPDIPNLIQFRKKDYKTRPDLLLFRFRNADQSKQYFSGVVAAFEQQEVAFHIEKTRKRRAPRAAIVELDTSDVLLPSAAAHLCRVALSATEHSEESGVSVCCTGLHPDFDPRVQRVIPTTRGEYAGWRLGYLIGSAVGSLRDRLSL